jgi:hypothetical protein
VAQRQLDQEKFKKYQHAETVTTKGMPVVLTDCT